MDRQAIERALETDMTVDISTIGRRTGQTRTIEIWFVNIDGVIYITGTVGDRDPGTRYPRDWLANVAAEPQMTLHLKQSIAADLPAVAHIVKDPERRRDILSRPETRWYREQGESLDDLVEGAPLIELTFVDEAAWLSR